MASFRHQVCPRTSTSTIFTQLLNPYPTLYITPPPLLPFLLCYLTTTILLQTTNLTTYSPCQAHNTLPILEPLFILKPILIVLTSVPFLLGAIKVHFFQNLGIYTTGAGPYRILVMFLHRSYIASKGCWMIMLCWKADILLYLVSPLCTGCLCLDFKVRYRSGIFPLRKSLLLYHSLFNIFPSTAVLLNVT